MWSTGFFLPLLLLLDNTAVAHVVSVSKEDKYCKEGFLYLPPHREEKDKEKRVILVGRKV
jgi:hypothetical protein